MKIGFYGHSLCQWHRQQELSWITKIQNHYCAEIVHSGCALCSEERILFDLKKTKNLDLAVILHSKPKYLFVPSWNRDIRTISPTEVLKKIEHSLFKRLGEDNPYVSKINLRNLIGITLGNEGGLTNTVLLSDSDAIRSRLEEDLGSLKDQIKKDVGIDYQEFIDALIYFKKYLYHPDLQMQRFHGALIQIDQYLLAKKIPVIHCLGKNSDYPKWFKFRSGETDNGFVQKFADESKYAVSRDVSDNVIDDEGNTILYLHVVKLIDKLLSL